MSKPNSVPALEPKPEAVATPEITLNSEAPVLAQAPDLEETSLAEEPPAEAEEAVANLSLVQRLRDPKTLIGFAISFVIILFFIFTLKIDFNAIWNNISQVNPLWLLGGFAAYYATFIVRAFRWNMILKAAKLNPTNSKYHQSIPALTEMIFLSWFVNSLVPAKLGDAYRGYMMKKNAKASFSQTLGTIFAERIADVLVLFGLLSLGGLIAFSNVESKLGDISLLFVFGIILVIGIIVGLIVLRYFGNILEKFIPKRFHPIFHKFQQGIVSSFNRKTQVPLYGYTVVVWLLEGMRLYCVLQGLGINQLGLSVIVFISLASSLLTIIPFTPAGLGAVEGTIASVLTTFAIEKNLASSVAILDRVISYWSVIVIGAIVYVISRKK